MKAVFAEGYWVCNLGDDLFLKILCNRYKDVSFKILANRKMYSNIAKNLEVKDNSKFLYKLFNKLTNKKLQNNIKLSIIKNLDYVVYIGGSIFMQKDKYKQILTDRYLKHNKKYFILGSNFGPYKDNEYKEFCKDKIFNKAEDVCFRESYSHELFKELDNIRHCADIVFSLDTSNINKENKKRVVFSIIDCNAKECGKYKEQYIQKIIELTEEFTKKEYEIIYMSFCKQEQDENGINEILQRLPSKCKVQTYNYNGNIQEALEVIASAQIIVGTRFHANIVGLLLNKKIIPIAYNNKTQNTLRDINYMGDIIDIRNIESVNINEIIEKNINYEFNVENVKKEAEGHFEKLDQYLKEE